MSNFSILERIIIDNNKNAKSSHESILINKKNEPNSNAGKFKIGNIEIFLYNENNNRRSDEELFFTLTHEYGHYLSFLKNHKINKQLDDIGDKISKKQKISCKEKMLILKEEYDAWYLGHEFICCALKSLHSYIIM